MTGSLQGFLEELLGRSRVSLSRKPEVDRGAAGIDGTIQVRQLPPWLMYVSSTLQEPLVGFNSGRHLLFSSGA